MTSQWLAIAVFGAVYLGMMLGGWPGLAIDRTGVALIGAIVLFVGGAAGPKLLGHSIDFRMLAILFALMVLSAQFAASGFFEWAAGTIARTPASPRRILAITLGVSAAMAALLTNDVIVWAMTPVLARGLGARGLDARPFVIGLAMAANAGSAATVIGNPQNLLIASAGRLDFWYFLAACGVPAVAALAVVYGVIAWRCRDALAGRAWPVEGGRPKPLERAVLTKGAIAAFAVIVVFTLPLDRAPWALAIAGVLLLSRRFSTVRMLSMVDWHLLVLFAALFVVTGALSATGAPSHVLAELGVENLRTPETLAIAAVAGSNTIGNVPLVMMVLASKISLGTEGLYALALFSTLAGNLFIVGSMANIIAIERAGGEGVGIGFRDYARIGIPVTVLSLVFAWAWVRFVLAHWFVVP